MNTKNKTIWKFILKPADTNYVEIPKKAEILSCQLQDGQICLWALVDPDEVKEVRKFGLIGTGHFIKQEEAKYIATLQLYKFLGHYNQVYHLFEF